MRQLSWRWINAVSFTLLLIALIAFATAEVVSTMFVAMLAMIALGVAFFFLVFPGSGFFTVAFTNFLAVYVCFFVFFRETNFAPVTGPAVPIGFALPIAAFLFGAWLRRAAIRSLITAERMREEHHFARILLWLLPVSAVGASTFFLPGLDLAAGPYQAIFLLAMGAIAAVVFAVSRDVCIFLLDTGLLFEEFFARMARLFVPVFAFFTFYSLVVIVFAAIYRILDRFSDLPHFLIGGAGRDITFSESLYFSLVTLSTVGYGDIIPHSAVVRVIVAVEIVAGVVLLLFGFSEILAYSRDRRRLAPPPRSPSRAPVNPVLTPVKEE